MLLNSREHRLFCLRSFGSRPKHYKWKLRTMKVRGWQSGKVFQIFVLIVLVSLGILSWSPAAFTQQEGGEILFEISEYCASKELTIWGRNADLTLFWGASGGTPAPLESQSIIWFCEGYREESKCPVETNYLWVSRTKSSQFNIICYSNPNF